MKPKMVTNSRDKDLPTKQDGNGRLWPGLKNPRIVRVSRALGGKDRHSKVSTVRGLRDRRVRLSVPTAIQLYDLQDRLGVNQPSKVVDWLLGAAHQEIDKLPPLQLPQGNLAHMVHQSLLPQSSTHGAADLSHENPSSHPPLVVENFEYMNNNEHEPRLTTLPVQSTYWSSDVAQRSKQHREAEEEDRHSDDDEKGNSTINGSSADVLPKVLAAPSLVAMAAPYTSYYHWEATNAYLSQFGIRTPSQAVEAPPTPWPLPVPDHSQILLCPQGPTQSSSSMFPSYFSASTDFDAKQFNIQTQTANSAQSNSARSSLHFGGTPVRPFQ